MLTCADHMDRHVAEQLFWTIVTLRFGRTPDDQDSEYSPSDAGTDSDDGEGIVPGWKGGDSDSDGGSSSDESDATAQTGDSYLGGYEDDDYDEEAWDNTPDDPNAKRRWRPIFHRDLVSLATVDRGKRETSRALADHFAAGKE